MVKNVNEAAPADAAAPAQVATPAAQSKPPKAKDEHVHPAHSVIAEIEAVFSKAGKIADADLRWLKAKLEALKAKL